MAWSGIVKTLGTTLNLRCLDYLSSWQVVLEVLRLIPPNYPFWMTMVAKEKDQIGDLVVKRGTVVLPLPYLSHTNRSLWNIEPRDNFVAHRFDLTPASFLGDEWREQAEEVNLGAKLSKKVKVLDGEALDDPEAVLASKGKTPFLPFGIGRSFCPGEKMVKVIIMAIVYEICSTTDFAVEDDCGMFKLSRSRRVNVKVCTLRGST